MLKCKKKSYAGLTNCYSKTFQEKIDYVSDSNGYWKFNTWDDILNRKNRLIQVLTHPIWWTDKNNLPPFEILLKQRLSKIENIVSEYLFI